MYINGVHKTVKWWLLFTKGSCFHRISESRGGFLHCLAEKEKTSALSGTESNDLYVYSFSKKVQLLLWRHAHRVPQWPRVMQHKSFPRAEASGWQTAECRSEYDQGSERGNPTKHTITKGSRRKIPSHLPSLEALDPQSWSACCSY